MVKACDTCGVEFRGFGTTCPSCRKKSTGAKAPGPGSGGGGSKDNACAVCGKPVYAMEKLEIEGVLMHAACFRCNKCNTKLGVGKFARTPAGVFYCPTHYKELFRLRGKYDETQGVPTSGGGGTGDLSPENMNETCTKIF